MESGTSNIEALSLFRLASEKFDLIITDFTMPDMSGDKLATNFMKIRPGIPILLCTGFSETLSKEKAIYMGIKGFLMKPIVKTDFALKVRGVLDK